MQGLTKRLAENGLHISVTDAALDFLADKGFDAEFGARPLKRVIQRMVEDKLSEEILLGNAKAQGNIQIDVKDGELVFLQKE